VHIDALCHIVNNSSHKMIAVQSVLRLSAPPDDLIDAAIAVSCHEEHIDNMWLADPQIGIDVMRRLLVHPNQRLRALAAIGEWRREPGKTVRPEIEWVWEQAVVEIGMEFFEIDEILRSYPRLSYPWIHQRLLNRVNTHGSSYGVKVAAQTLEDEQRLAVLRMMTRDNYSNDIFDAVIVDRLEMYREWLIMHREDIALWPLNREPSERWERMAAMAFDAGVSPESLAENCIDELWERIGGELPDDVARRILAYKALELHPDARFRLAASCVLAKYERLEAEWREDDRRMGFDD
jgi:hypothetical protein